MKKFLTIFKNNKDYFMLFICLSVIIFSAIHVKKEKDIPITKNTSETLEKATAKVEQENIFPPLTVCKIIRTTLKTPVYFKDHNLYTMHQGTDFYAKKGDNVFSMCAGVVQKTTDDSVTLLFLNGKKAEYKGVYDICVKENQTVQQGDIIGKALGCVPLEEHNILHIFVSDNTCLYDIQNTNNQLFFVPIQK